MIANLPQKDVAKSWEHGPKLYNYQDSCPGPDSVHTREEPWHLITLQEPFDRYKSKLSKETTDNFKALLDALSNWRGCPESGQNRSFKWDHPSVPNLMSWTKGTGAGACRFPLI